MFVVLFLLFVVLLSSKHLFCGLVNEGPLMHELVNKMQKLDWLWIGSLLLVILSAVGLAYMFWYL